MKKNILMQTYESPYGTYFCGKNLFEKLAMINSTCKELVENFSETPEEKLSEIIVDDNLEFQTSTNDEVFDKLLSYILINPQVKITYTMDGFTRIKFKFKSVKKAKIFIDLCKFTGAMK